MIRRTRHAKKHTLAAVVSAAALSSLALASSPAQAAAAAPSGAHPRIWIGTSTLGAMKAKLGDASSAASSVVASCDHLLLPVKASEFKQAGDEGYNWAYSGLTCALAYRLTGKATYATAGVTLFKALLDDYTTIGDGAGGDSAVTHDTGYGMRFFAAYSALLYDWLHDAPGVDASLLSHARDRFAAWVNWYEKSGYLKSTPGSNYHAGYVFAKTLMAIAEGGEGGSGDAHWADVTTNMFPNELVKDGLGQGGALAGGDNAEGWEYGALTVMEYALAARALEEQGIKYPEIEGWASSVVVRFLHGLNPSQSGLYPGGDYDDVSIDVPLTARPLIATLVGPSSDQAAAWAWSAKGTITKDPDQCPVFDALAEARAAATTAFTSTSPATAYLAPGTRNFYVRSDWTKSAVQAVFTSAPRLVPDHQHFDASNLVLNRGADHLIVDPSSYGSRSPLSSNAMTVDSNAVNANYRPGQSPFGSADLPWARATADGVAAARGEIENAFVDEDGKNGDVKLARRDFAFLPEGEVVTIDRVSTGDASRKAYLRFHTRASLTGSGGAGSVYRAEDGESAVALHPVALSSGSPSTDSVAVGNCWSSNQFGTCTAGRFPSSEYKVTLSGPTAFAVHVLDALGKSDDAATVASIQSADVDPDGDNKGVLGASVLRGTTQSYVLSTTAMTTQSVSSITYSIPGGAASRHVVFDAPEDASGMSAVRAVANGDRCEITITAGGAGAIVGHPLIFNVAAAASGCGSKAATEVTTTSDPTGAVGTTSGVSTAGADTIVGGDDDGSDGASGKTSSDGSPVKGGVGCSVSAGATSPPAAFAWLLGATATLLTVRRRRAS